MSVTTLILFDCCFFAQRMELTTFQITIAILGGLVAGFINTLAGNGSAITLTILIEVLGLPPSMANGTNRVGIMAQSITGTWAFHKEGKLHLHRNLKYIIPIVIGAIGGALLAANVSNDQFKSVFKFLMVIMLGVILVKPKRWLRATDLEKSMPLYLHIPIFLALGFYAGFIQMGMGVIFLAVMVLLAKVNIMESNAIKMMAVGLLTIFALSIFHYKGLVDWKIGGIMAIGQATGGWATATYVSRYKRADEVAYWVLVVIVLVAVIRLFWVG